MNGRRYVLSKPTAGGKTWIALPLILAVAFLFRLLLVPVLRNKQTHDLRIFVSWAQLLVHFGSHGLYQHVDTIDHYPVNYPPLFAVVLGVVDAVYKHLVSPGAENVTLLGMLLKIPAIAADIVLCAVVFVIVRRWVDSRRTLAAVALAAFAPSTWPISVLWGQVDSICSALMMIALVLVFQRRFTLAWGALALAVLVKPLPIVLAPLLLAVQIRDQGWSWQRSLVGPAFGVLIAYFVSLPFAPSVAPFTVLLWLAREYAGGQALTDSTSVNAYNIWTLAWGVTSDSRVVLGLTLHAWGWLVFSVIVAATTCKLLQRLTQESNSVVQEQLITRAWFVVLVALFLFQTRMHERYILFALALAPLMLFCGRWERRAAVTLIASFTICVILVLGFYEHSVMKEALVVTHFLSFINISAFAAVLISFFVGNVPTASTSADTMPTRKRKAHSSIWRGLVQLRFKA